MYIEKNVKNIQHIYVWVVKLKVILLSSFDLHFPICLSQTYMS